MTKNEFLNITRKFFRQCGFQLIKKSKFYFEANDFILEVQLQHSNYDELYYINFNVRIKDLHKEAQKIDDLNAWDLFLGRIIDGNDKAYTVEYPLMDGQVYLKQLQEKVEEQLKPIINEGIVKLLWLDKSGITYVHFKPGIINYLETLIE